jgi:hypothetical protein
MSRGARYFAFLALIAAIVLGLSTSVDRPACAAGFGDVDFGTGGCSDGTGPCPKIR